MKGFWVPAKYIACQGPFPLLSLIMSNCLGCDVEEILENGKKEQSSDYYAATDSCFGKSP